MQNEMAAGVACGVAALTLLVVRELYERYRVSGKVVWGASRVRATAPPTPSPSATTVEKTVFELRSLFASGATKVYATRVRELRGLLRFVEEQQEAIVEALASDLGRPRWEALCYDVYLVRMELLHLLSSLNRLSGWQRTPLDMTLVTFPGTGYVVPDPLGVCLVMSTWNFPVMLGLVPVAGALAAGNAVVLKPCHRAPACAKLLEKVADYVSNVKVVAADGRDADIKLATDLLNVRFDKIFFTGSTRVGKIVAKKAAEFLTPCVLELGGKNPVYVHKDAHIATAAKRIVWGRMLNAGQQCIAPDYVLCDAAVCDKFLAACQSTINNYYSEDPSKTPDYGRIIAESDAKRLQGLLASCKEAGDLVVCGGDVQVERRYVAPTIVKVRAADSPLLQDETFGPILVVLPVDGLGEALEFVNARPKPLSSYVFTSSKTVANTFIATTSAGNTAINDTIFQCAHPAMPFGGVGDSGNGAYHGDRTFAAFVHYKAVLDKPTIQNPLTHATFFVYPPTTGLKFRLTTLIMAPSLYFSRRK